MVQKLISGGWFPINKDNTSFTSLHGEHPWTAITPNFSAVSTFAVAGTLRKFRMRLRDVNGDLTAPSAGETYTVTVRKAEVDTGLEVVLDEDSSDKTDTTNEVAISAGDQMDLKCVPGGSPLNDRYPLWSFEFEPTNSNESVYFVTGGLWYKTVPEGFFSLTPDASNPFSTSEAQVQQILAIPGKIKDGYLELSDNPGSGADAYWMTLRKNGADTNLVVKITGAATSGTDLVNEVTVAAGDLVCWKKEAISVPQNNLSARAGFAFEADTVNQSLFINGHSSGALDTSVTKYYSLSHNIKAWDTDEFKQYQYAQGLTVSKFYVRVSAAPGAGKSWAFRVRRNGANTDIVVTITNTDTTGSDLVNTATVSDDDYLDIESTPSGTPAAAAGYFGSAQSRGAVVSPDPNTAVGALVRVTALVVHWSAGPNAVYQEEILTGGLFSQYFSPISPIKEPEPTLQTRGPARQLPGPVPTLREYGQWLATHSQAEQRAILRGIPGADVLTLRVWQEWVVGRRRMGQDV